MPKLKVLHIITHLAVGGASETVLSLCRFADPELVECAILCGVTSPLESDLKATAAREGIPVHVLPSLQRAIRPVADWRASQEIVDWLRKGRWDVVHTHSSKAGVIGRLAASKAGVPVIVHTVHGWGHHSHMHPIIRRFYIAAERRAARVTDRLVTVSDANRDKGLADSIGKYNQYETIPIGINIKDYRDVVVDRDALRQSLGIPVDALVVGTVSRLAVQKAPEDFVRMAAYVHAEVPNAHFVLVGGGPLEASLMAQIAEAGLSSVIHTLGYRDDVPQLLRIFDIFVLTSLWEGLPRVFAQAECAGLPIVATRVDGAPEAVRHGENGFLVEPKNPKQQSEYVIRLLKEPELRRLMGEIGFQAPQVGEKDMTRRLEALYFACARAKRLPIAMSHPEAKEAPSVPKSDYSGKVTA